MQFSMGVSCSSDDGQTGSLKPKRCPLTADLSASYHVQNAIDKLLLEPWEVEYIHNFWVSLPKCARLCCLPCVSDSFAVRKQEPKGAATGSKQKKQSKQADAKGKGDSKSASSNQQNKKGKKGKKQQEKQAKKEAKGAVSGVRRGPGCGPTVAQLSKACVRHLKRRLAYGETQ